MDLIESAVLGRSRRRDRWGQLAMGTWGQPEGKLIRRVSVHGELRGGGGEMLSQGGEGRVQKKLA